MKPLRWIALFINIISVVFIIHLAPQLMPFFSLDPEILKKTGLGFLFLFSIGVILTILCMLTSRKLFKWFLPLLAILLSIWSYYHSQIHTDLYLTDDVSTLSLMAYIVAMLIALLISRHKSTRKK